MFPDVRSGAYNTVLEPNASVDVCNVARDSQASGNKKMKVFSISQHLLIQLYKNRVFNGMSLYGNYKNRIHQ